MSGNKPHVVFFIGVVVIFSLLFFSINIFPDAFHTLELGGIFIAILISVPYMFIRSGGIVLCIHVIIISILFSFFMAKVSWGQDYFETLKASLPFMTWFFFFYLVRQKVQISALEKIVVFYGIIYIILFLFQYTNSHTVYFGFKNDYKEDRGIIRILFPGEGIFILTLFIALNRYSETVRGRAGWLFLLIIGYIIIVMQVTRQTITIVTLVYIYHFIKGKPSYKKAFNIIAIAGVGIFVIFQNIEIVNGLLSVHKARNAGFDSKNIRVLAGDFFINKYSPAGYNQIFGNGIPYPDNKYGLFETVLKNLKGFYFFDVGLIAFYVFFGVFALFALLAILFQCYKIPVPKKNEYLKYYIFFLIFTGLISDSLLSYNYLIVNVFVFYMFYVIDIQNKAADKNEQSPVSVSKTRKRYSTT